MRILGIDPGSRRIGYGIVDNGASPKLVAAGLIPIVSSSDAPALVELRARLLELVEEYRPEVIGVEKLFFTNNRTTGIAVGQARGVILECLSGSGMPLIELTPNEVKQGVTGSGNADKRAVAKMVRLVLGQHDLTLIDDAMDALAIALVAGQRARLAR